MQRPLAVRLSKYGLCLVNQAMCVEYMPVTKAKQTGSNELLAERSVSCNSLALPASW